ncbi:DUF488 family protein [Gillisia hiemivivida]|uniref:DUF488 domain-containing protein n=1 Tax=Gillisia hiemivivida TaxID=291190 RepID=A0A5C6ZWS2_9FLAO|nr:DUF488 domain-containing protein [Gillisia hiemivivida]TXD94772.1 DUF488 domain-containing protein [Gillisia hiemivivida]
MTQKENKKLWTIGHSTHSLDNFIDMLESYNIVHLVDIRRFPSSRKFPQLNKENLEKSLTYHNIQYNHLEELGGRRKANPDSKNTIWRNTWFMGYADYMETSEFKEGLETLKKMAFKKRKVITCSEAVWWRCLCSMVSDIMKAEEWKVMHIMGIGKEQEHPYTEPAKIIKWKLSYENL